MRIITLVLSFFCIFQTKADSYADVGLPMIHVFSQDDYDAHNQNWDIEQADNQFIYVANGNGLLEFDGETWQLYATPNRSRVREIEIVDDKIYAGTSNDLGYYQANEQGILTFHSLLHLIAEENRQFGDVLSVVALNDYV
ncbi:MAG TPA: transcriptional regulator, partial [Oceanospirillales bacterium]|nr:transcriptional regulator [Oceanospirillales bacterium]